MRKLSVPEKHQVAIAKKTLLMPDALVGVLGGMTKDEARRVLREKAGCGTISRSLGRG